MDDNRELLDYLIKIINNNFSRILEIWDPIEMVLLGYTDFCIKRKEKQKTSEQSQGKIIAF